MEENRRDNKVTTSVSDNSQFNLSSLYTFTHFLKGEKRVKRHTHCKHKYKHTYHCE